MHGLADRGLLVYTGNVHTTLCGSADQARPLQRKAAMLKNITLSADEELIALARQKASRQGTTLNAQFRVWLRAFIEQEQTAREYRQLMRDLSYARPGRRFSRDDLNAR